MDHGEAVSLLEERLPASRALEVLQGLDPARVELFRIEGFLRDEDGQFEARLDLIVDFSHMQQFTIAERIEIARMFIRNRATNETYFELWPASP
jgi:hypothetical protein